MTLSALLLVMTLGQSPAADADVEAGAPETAESAAAAPADEAPAQPDDAPTEATPAPAVEAAPANPATPAMQPWLETRRVDGWSTNFGVDGLELRLNAALRLSQSVSSPVVLDETGTTTRLTPFETRLRLAPELRYRFLSLVSEFDVLTGAALGIPDASVVAGRVPTPAWHAADLRQLYFQYRWRSGLFRGGLQTSHFGLGMLANAGAQDAQSGDFGMQHRGTIALRALFAGRPFLGVNEWLSLLEPFAAFDLVVRDGTADLQEGDRALHGIVGLRFNFDERNVLALTLIYRNQRRPGGTPDERSTDAYVLDVSGKWTLWQQGSSWLDVGAEVAAITGTTTQGRADVAPVLDVRQLGAVAKVTYASKRFGLLFDAGYASGDQNPYDTQLNNFRFDRDYKVGLVLFDQVLGYQSARTAWRAGDPQLSGYPPEGLDLLPTAGALTGAWYLFPRARLTVTEGLDVYGGPLFAFASATPVDVFNTRLNGGEVLNSLGARGGRYYGTELDLGVNLKLMLARFFKLTATLEGGVLFPGDAFRQADGSLMAPVGLGRLRFTAQL